MTTLFAVGVAIVVVVLLALALSLRIVNQYEQGSCFASAG